MRNTFKSILIAAMLGFILLASNSGAASEPPASVKRYLAERGILVSATKEAVVNQSVYLKKQADDTRVLLEYAGIPISKELGQGVSLIKQTESAALEDVTVQLGADTAPVLRTAESPMRFVPLRQVVFRLHEDATLDAVKAVLISYGAAEPRPIRDRQYVVDLSIDDGHWTSLELSAALSEIREIDWAVPNCIRETKKHYLPNDLDSLWNMRNTNAAPWTNSAALPAAWNTTLGDPGVVIAIIDDGIQLDHPDLQDNIWLNPGEVPGDMADNDGNGYVDDVNGWDFYKGTNIVAPTAPEENHGTALAGIAAGRGDNGLGICGAAPRCTLLPVKMWSGDLSVTDLQLAEAVTYAARYAKIINLSFGQPDGLDNQLIDAYNAASTSSLIFASTANDADLGAWYDAVNCSQYFFGWYGESTNISGSGTHTCRWTYVKDNTASVGRDSAWLDAVTLPDGQHFDFESGAWSNGWATGGDQPWFFSPESNDSIAVGAYSLRSGPITDSQTSWVEVAFTGTGTLSFYYQAMGERFCEDGVYLGAYDYLTIWLDGSLIIGDETTTEDVNDPVYAENQQDLTRVQFPAALTSIVAVGASDITGYRATYSCFDTNLEILAPSSGATDQTEVRTTDRTGTNGYNTTAGSAGDYDNTFGGTSGSTPLACGIAALLFSANPDLTLAEARNIIRQSARKIGTVPYISGFNERYGYGQIDAASAMHLMLSNMPPKIVRLDENGNQFRMATIGIETTRNYTVYGASDIIGNSWQWTPITSDNGTPAWGTNWTPYIERTSSPPYRVYKIEK